MKTKYLTIVVVMLLFSTYAFSQQKYAVLISGVAPSWDQMQVPSGLTGNIPTPHQFDEFWNDTFLMWELLTQKYQYDYENVIVLYANGTDYIPDNANTRYRASRYGLQHITDGDATLNHVSDVLTNLQSELTADDFLFIWTFGHGFQNLTGSGFLQLNDGQISDNIFGSLVNPIPAKKVVWMQNCAGGDFEKFIFNEMFLSTASSE